MAKQYKFTARELVALIKANPCNKIHTDVDKELAVEKRITFLQDDHECRCT
jgi:hypothetical protein